MKFYSKDKTIGTVEDVKAFFIHLCDDLGYQWHPDDPFTPFTLDDGTEFGEDLCEIYNRVMDDCFDLTIANCMDIYRLALEIYEGKRDGVEGETYFSTAKESIRFTVRQMRGTMSHLCYLFDKDSGRTIPEDVMNGYYELCLGYHLISDALKNYE